jgi:hypothetical protein
MFAPASALAISKSVLCAMLLIVAQKIAYLSIKQATHASYA